MASYHMQINTGGKGAALEHAQYIQREGPFTEERYGEVAARGHANMPEWARENTAEFWRASDEHERANGNTYREYELALPRELSRSQQVALVQRFAEQELGTTRPYQWAIHLSTASDGKEQPHVHLMFSDRQHDGIERGPEQFFKRYNAKNPERGGARKMSYGVDKEEAARTYEGIRERWAKVQNLALEHAGVETRVDHRSLAAQGIHREPEVHRGPAVSGIEGRGEVSQVGERQREQMRARTQAREMVVAEVRVVTREEVAAERVAVRERRDLAREVTGADRAVVLPLVEADRREQLGRAQAAAERRVERRQGLANRGAAGRETRHPGAGVAGADWARARAGQGVGAGALSGPAQADQGALAGGVRGGRSRRRGGAGRRGRRKPRRSRSAPSLATKSAACSTDCGCDRSACRRRRRSAMCRRSGCRCDRSPRSTTARDRAAEALHQSVDRYARAWMDAWRMREKDLPVLEHQKTELKHAGEDLDKHRPGARQDLHTALRHEPQVVRAMMELRGRAAHSRTPRRHRARGARAPRSELAGREIGQGMEWARGAAQGAHRVGRTKALGKR